MIKKETKTYWARIYMSGPIEVAKQILRSECMEKGLCVTVEPTLFIYTGGEEQGYVVGMIQYPRFPAAETDICARANKIAERLMMETHQWSALVMTPEATRWITSRAD